MILFYVICTAFTTGVMIQTIVSQAAVWATVTFAVLAVCSANGVRNELRRQREE